MARIKPPRMRIGRRIKQDELVKIKVRFEHPSFTGLGQVWQAFRQRRGRPPQGPGPRPFVASLSARTPRAT